MRKNSKPLYYDEYTINNTNLTKKSNKTFIILLTIFVFLSSIIDLSYSYLKIDICQDKVFFISLNSWLRLNGIYCFFYYLFMIIIIYFLFYYDKDSDNYDKGYDKLVNITQLNNANEIQKEKEKTYKMLATFFTAIYIFSLIFGTYIFFSFFGKECSSYAINVYIWIKIMSGFISSIFFIFYIYS